MFIDESGNFDFSPKGTEYFILTCFATFDPMRGRDNLIHLRYALLADGFDQDFFHASEDRQLVRDKVYAMLSSLSNTYEVHSIFAKKNKANPALYQEKYIKRGQIKIKNTGMKLYELLCKTLLRYVSRGKSSQVSNIVVVIGSLFVGKKKKVLIGTLKSFLKECFHDIPFHIYSHPMSADLNCQLADYCCWAVSVKLHRGDMRPYAVIAPQVRSEFDIFKEGKEEYYQMPHK